MSYTSLLRAAQTIQAVSLLDSSARRAMKKKKRSGDFLEGASELFIGSALIKASDDFI